MSKTSKILSVIIITLLVATFGLLYNKISFTSFLTDSGFDSSYDSGGGGSWGGGGSSWDSGGSSHDYSSSGGSSSSSDGGDFWIFIIFILVAYIVVSTSVATSVSRSSSEPPLKLYKSRALTPEQFNEKIKGITLEDFIFQRISDLIQVQYNWTNFKYDKLREKLTDELYNQYEMQLKTLELKGQKNVMTNFKSLDSMVTKVEEINGRYTVTMEVIMSFIDYIEQNGIAIRGDSKNPITIKYELVYTSSANGIVDKCPKCGGELKDTTSQVCPYCKTQIVQDSTNWVMSKKKSLGQR